MPAIVHDLDERCDTSRQLRETEWIDFIRFHSGVTPWRHVSLLSSAIDVILHNGNAKRTRLHLCHRSIGDECHCVTKPVPICFPHRTCPCCVVKAVCFHTNCKGHTLTRT